MSELGFRFALQRFAAEDRTEPATPRRRQEARRRGQVARTGELGLGISLVAMLLAGSALAGSLVAHLENFTRRLLGQGLSGNELTETGALRLLLDAVLAWAWVGLPLALLAAFMALLSQVAQVGFMATTKPLQPDWQRLNPIKGMQRILSRRAFAELIKSVFKVTIIGFLAYRVLREGVYLFPGLLQHDLAQAIQLTAALIYRTGMQVGAGTIVLAALDYLYQRWETEQSLRMTKKEVKEEVREQEGDPHLRARLRKRQRQLATVRMMHEVPRADVVVTNPTHLAVALRYTGLNRAAPVIVAKGAGPLAERIKAVARQHHVPVVENVSLARALFDLGHLGAEIPESLYQAVAEVLAFVYRLKRAGM